MTPHEAEIDAWHARRLERLRAPDGWLALAGRWELEADPVELPIGVATADERGVRIGDAHHAYGTRFARDGLQWEVSRLAGVAVVRVRDPNAPTRLAFRGIPRFPVDPRYRVRARIVPADAPAAHTYASGARVVRDSPGRLAFTLDGVPCTLGATRDGDQLMIVFADPTNGDTTYGAGRFVYVDWDGGSEVDLDFNRAVNPPCSLTEYAACPVVPDEDQLPMPVLAGERYPIDAA